MRQLRVKSDLCYVQTIRSKCTNNYNLLNEEKHSSTSGWINQTAQIHNLSIYRSFEYQSSNQLDT
jgi:hypothetical protein